MKKLWHVLFTTLLVLGLAKKLTAMPGDDNGESRKRKAEQPLDGEGAAKKTRITIQRAIRIAHRAVRNRCIVCTSRISPDEVATQLLCTHNPTHHKDCLATWLALHPTCPSCRCPSKQKLFDAARKGDIEKINEIRSLGINVFEVKDLLGATILHTAIIHKQNKLIDFLLNRLDNTARLKFMDAKNNAGETALHAAAHSSNIPAAITLLNNFANYAITNNHEETALEIAKNKGDIVMATIIENHKEKRRMLIGIIIGLGVWAASTAIPTLLNFL